MRVCFFDIDGTLVATGGAGMKAFATCFRQLFGVEEIARGVPFAGRSDRAIATDLMRSHDVDPCDENFVRFKQAYVEELKQELHRCVGEVLPGVAALIDELKAAGNVGIGLLTGNVVLGAEAKLRHYDLWQHFAYGGFGDVHTDRSGIARSAVVAAEQHHNTKRTAESRIAVIGDTPHDVTCARAIDAFAVAVPTGNTSLAELKQSEPDLAVETLEDAGPLVEWLAA